jgi:hypothetical protein
MSLLGELVLDFLIESALLAIVWDGIAGAVAWVTGRLRGAWSLRTFLFSLAGAVIVASLARRLGFPLVWELDIGRRELPMLWSVGGAVVGAALSLIRRGQPVAEAAAG